MTESALHFPHIDRSLFIWAFQRALVCAGLYLLHLYWLKIATSGSPPAQSGRGRGQMDDFVFWAMIGRCSGRTPRLRAVLPAGILPDPPCGDPANLEWRDVVPRGARWASY